MALMSSSLVSMSIIHSELSPRALNIQRKSFRLDAQVEERVESEMPSPECFTKFFLSLVDKARATAARRWYQIDPQIGAKVL